MSADEIGKYGKKWPQAWRDAVKTLSDLETLDERLDRLNAVGALKEPPKPRQVWICLECRTIEPSRGGAGWHAARCGAKPILMREVIND